MERCRQKAFVKNLANTTAPLSNSLLLNHGNRVLKKFLFSLLLVVYRDDQVDTIKIVNRNGPLKSVLTLMSKQLAAYWMKKLDLRTRGNPNLPEVVKTKQWRGDRFNFFYEEGKRAQEKVVRWLQTGVSQNFSVA